MENNIEKAPKEGEYLSPQETRRKFRAVSMLEKVILLAVTIFVIAFIVPPALTAIATSALTSVNTAVQTLFQLLLSIIAVVAIILLIYYETVRKQGHGL